MSTEIAAPNAGAPAAVRALLREAEQSFESARPDAAIALAERAAALARECNDRPLLGWGLMLLGNAQNCLGQPAQGHASAGQGYELLGACGETSSTLGITLCKEIAAEMGGSLQTMRADDAALHYRMHYRLHYRLQLPEARARVRELPSAAELR
jgi:hypothetical protein